MLKFALGSLAVGALWHAKRSRLPQLVSSSRNASAHADDGRAATHQDSPRKVVLVTDLGRDVDDTMCLHMLAHEQFENKSLELVGVITCGGSTVESACIGQLSRGTPSLG